MSLFLLTFLLLYGGMHGYYFRKFMQTHPTRGGMILMLCFVVVMVFGPPLVRILERNVGGWIARPLAYLSYTWMGWLLLFVTFCLLVDVARLGLWLVRLVAAGAPVLQLPVSDFVLAAVVATVLSAYGLWEAQHVLTERVTIEDPRVPSSVGRFRIVQISDVHLGLINREKRLAKLVEKIRVENPDLVVSTGDLVDGQLTKQLQLVPPLRDLAPRYGKLAILGNHEVYAGLPQALQYMRACDFRVLRNERLHVAPFLVVDGEDDPVAHSAPGGFPAIPDAFTLLLKHRPDVDLRHPFTLQLSGHVHKGQIFPFSFVTRMVYPIATGLTRLEGGRSIYVSRGTGTWGPPIRVFAPPEITVIDLVHKR